MLFVCMYTCVLLLLLFLLLIMTFCLLNLQEELKTCFQMVTDEGIETLAQFCPNLRK